MRNYREIFQSFNKLKIAVVGDVMIDAYIRGSVTRISPEAPVPIINLQMKEDRLGGAGNVALNLVALGVQTELISVVGQDEASEILIRLLQENHIGDSGIVNSKNRITTIKTRVIGNNQHLLRVDKEQTDAITEQEELELLSRVEKAIKNGLNAIILEDYNKGVLSSHVISEIVRMANENNVYTTVDPKKDNFLTYKNVTLFKPNLKELREGLNRKISMQNLNDLKSAVEELESELENKISFITLSEHGVFIKDDKENFHIPAHLRNIADVSGAGDTVISTATVCLAAGMSIQEIAEIANLAGGIVCEHSGVVAIEKEVLLEEVEKQYHGHSGI